MSGYRPEGSAVVIKSGGGKSYANVKITCGSRAILFDPDHWPDLRAALDQAAEDASAMKQTIVEERTIRYEQQ